MSTYKCRHCGASWSAGPTRDMNTELECRICLGHQRDQWKSRAEAAEAELAIEREDRGLLCFADNAAARQAGAEAALRWAWDNPFGEKYYHDPAGRDEFIRLGIIAIKGRYC